MGMFHAVNDAKVYDGGVYFLEGNYKVKVIACKAVRSRKNTDLFIVECLILESSQSQRPVGSKASWVVNVGQDAGPGNVRGFVATATGAEVEEVDEAVCELVCSDEQPLKDVELALSAVPITTRAGKPFTKHIWGAL